MPPNFLKEAAALYGVQASELQPAPGGNTAHVYFARREKKEFVLRITPPDKELDFQGLQLVQNWMAYLSGNGGPAARLYPALDGELAKKIETEEGEYAVCAQEKATGLRAETLPLEDWTAALQQAVGKAAGHLHRLAQDYKSRKPQLQHPEWDEINNCFRTRPLLADQTSILEKYEHYYRMVKELPRPEGAYGVIHTDFHWGNFFIDPAQNLVTVFDFDDCSRGWYVMDISMNIFDILVLHSGKDKTDYAKAYLQEFLKGYRRQKEIDPFWLEQIPLFLKLLEIGVYSQVYRYYDPQDRDSWIGKFMSGRKTRILEDIPYTELDFSKLAG